MLKLHTAQSHVGKHALSDETLYIRSHKQTHAAAQQRNIIIKTCRNYETPAYIYGCTHARMQARTHARMLTKSPMNKQKTNNRQHSTHTQTMSRTNKTHKHTGTQMQIMFFTVFAFQLIYDRMSVLSQLLI